MFTAVNKINIERWGRQNCVQRDVCWKGELEVIQKQE